MPGTFYYLLLSYPINKGHLCQGNGDLLCPGENPRIYVHTICTGSNVRETCTGSAAGYIFCARQLGWGCGVSCACALCVLCGYSISIYYMYILYVEKFTENIVRCAQCTWGSVGIYYIYNIVCTSCPLK